jgi:hypothetical protein
LLVEAGPKLTASIIEAGYYDDLVIYIAPILLGSDANNLVKLTQIKNIKQKIQFSFEDIRQIGPDLRVTLKAKKMTLIDTHCHLDQPALFKNIERVIENSLNNDVERIVVPSVSPENLNEVIKISQRFDLCSLALGFHPFFADRVKDDDFKTLSILLVEHDAVAVGEIGLDKFLDNIPLSTQEKILKKQLDIADKLELPIIVHARGYD